LVLEGGYDLGALAGGVTATLEVLGREGPVEPPQVAVHDLLGR
jgi:hypothetical protein